MNAPSLLLLCLPCTLVACAGAFVPIQTVETTGIAITERAAKMTVITSSETGSLQALGEVTGYSCKNKIWDPAATAEAATFQVKLAAAQRGATTVSTPSCEESAVSLLTNCWQSFSCKAKAYK